MVEQPSPTIDVCVLNWNGRAFLEACLKSLDAQSYRPQRVMVVDNGSTDESARFVRNRFPNVQVLETGGNLGFAGGNNKALAMLDADIILLFNPDVVLSHGCLAALAEGMTDTTIGIAGCKLWYPGGRVIQHAGGYVTRPRAMPRHFGKDEADDGQYDEAREVEYVIGAAMAVRREMLDHIGLFDDGYFLYFEDADLCARARRQGYRVVYLPQATAVHVESATAIKGSFAYFHRFHAGRWRYLLKHFPADFLLSETFPAESLWLDPLGDRERRAVSLSYLAILHTLPEILAIRSQQGAGAVSAGEAQMLNEALSGLSAKARLRGADSPQLARLAELARLETQPFRSRVPLFGPAIAGFRRVWNEIASRWYVDHFMAQQNSFNGAAIDLLRSYESEIQEQMALLEEEMALTIELGRRIEELKALLAELEQEQRAAQRGH